MVDKERKALQHYERRRLQREENSQLNGEEGYHKVWEAALSLLDYRGYSSGELQHKLQDKGYPIEIITAVIKRLKEVGLIDDYAYARGLLRAKFSSKGLVGPALRADLKRKAIDLQIIDELIDEIDSAEIREKAEEMVLKKLPALRQVDFQKRRNRLISMLLRKGYPSSISYEVVDVALEIDADKEE